MASINLDPSVVGKLSQFKRRRIRLLVTRGFCATAVAFLLCVAAVALIDWYWLLADQTRWGLSLGGIGLVLLVAWFSAFQPLLDLPGDEEAAALIEKQEPELREKLLSAVELAATDSSSLYDSPLFRSLLQGQVAGQMKSVRVSRLLPIRLVAKWLAAAFLVVGAAVALLTLGDSRIRQLVARAIMPGANIARVSRIQVKIIKPDPPSRVMAEDETVAILVDVSGGKVSEAILEVSSSKKGVVRHAMRRQKEKSDDSDSIQFAYNLHLTDEPIEYRVFAGDAITQRYKIDTRSRPRVESFHKNYIYPEYTRLENKSVTETQGDLIAFEGTRVELGLKVDQELSVAELKLVPLDIGEPTLVPMREENGKWMADVSIDKPSIYQVRLVGKETGFENVFAPKHEIRPVPDLVPRISFHESQKLKMLLPPNDVLSLKATAEDDLPLVKIEQLVSINGQDWTRKEILGEPEVAASLRHELDFKWDLLQVQTDAGAGKLQTGDQVVTKLVATDRKGNSAESVSLQVIIADPKFDPLRHTSTNLRLELMDDIKTYTKLTGQRVDSAIELVQRLRSAKTANELEPIYAGLKDYSVKQHEQSLELLKKVRVVLARMKPGVDSYELDLTGRLLAKLAHDFGDAPRHLIGVIQAAADRNQLKQRIDEIKWMIERSKDAANSLQYHFEGFVTQDFLASLEIDVEQIRKQQALVVEKSDQPWFRVMRQEAILIGQMQGVMDWVEQHRDRFSESLIYHLDRMTQDLDKQMIRIQDASESEEKFADLKRVNREFLNHLNGMRPLNFDSGIASKVTGGMRDFDNRSGRQYEPMMRLFHTARRQRELRNQLDSKDTGEKRKRGELKEIEKWEAEFRQQTGLVLRYRSSLEQLGERRDITRSRQDGDQQFASDASLAVRVVRSLVNQHLETLEFDDSEQTEPVGVALKDSKIPEYLEEIAPAWRTLEAGHELVHVRSLLVELLARERWESRQHSSRVNHPRYWEAINLGMEFASQRLKGSGIDARFSGGVDSARWSESARSIGRRVLERRWKRDGISSAAHELEELQKQLDQVIADLKPVMDEARAVIAKHLPSIPEMARQAAKDVRQLEEKTLAAADKPEERSSEIDQLQQKQESVNRQLDDLIESLVEHANSRDLLDAEEREQARDADNSIAMVEPPAKEMNRQLEEAKQADKARQPMELEEAADAQEQTAQALDLIAEHFGKLEEGSDVEESRKELRQFEMQASDPEKTEKKYEKAEELGKMAEKNLQELMKELEAELQRNPAMQKALSEISENAVKDARDALKYAAEDEKQIQAENERADAELQEKKAELSEELKKLAAESSKLSRELVQQAKAWSQAGKTDEAAKKLEETQKKLNDVASKAAQANPGKLLRELQDIANETQDAVKEATDALKQGKAETEKGKNTKIHPDENARKNQKANAEKFRADFQKMQKKVLENEKKAAENQKRAAEQRENQAKRQAQSAQNRLNQAKQRAQRQPENQGLQNAVRQAEQQKSAADQRVKKAEGEKKRAEEQVKKKADAIAQQNKKQQKPLNAANPSTELANEFAEDAVKKAEELAKKADALANKSKIENELNPNAQQLANAERKQGEVKQDVKNTSEDLARAARHEQRLKNAAAQKALENEAAKVEDIAKKEASQAESDLGKAADQAKKNADEAQKANAQAPSKPNQAAAQAQKATAKSEESLRQQAKSLDDVLEKQQAAKDAANQGQASEAKPENAGQTQQGNDPQGNDTPQGQKGQPQKGDSKKGDPQNGQPQNGQPQNGQPQNGQSGGDELTPAEIERGRQLAQTLDELDRQMAQNAAQGTEAGSPQSGDPQSGDPQSGDPQSGDPAASQSSQGSQPATAASLNSLSQAAQAQQASMARSRSQARTPVSQPAESGFSDEGDILSPSEETEDFVVQKVDRKKEKDWGKLRGKSAEGVSSGKSSTVSAAYREKVEAYFRAISERAGKKR